MENKSEPRSYNEWRAGLWERKEAHRRKGAGRLLIETMLKHLKADGVEELWLGTATDNVEAHALYTATGANQIGGDF